MDDFPLAKRVGYFATAGVGIPPASAARAVAEYVQLATEDPEEAMAVARRAAEVARAAFAELVGASPGEVAVAGPGTLAALERALTAVGCGAGRNIVTDDLEYPGLLNLAATFARRCGYELRVVRHREGQLSLDEFKRAVDGETAAVVVSSVQWINGVRLDVDALGELVERTGAFLIVDGIQEAGVRRPALRRVDFYAAGTQKWLIAPFGVALAYVGSRMAERQSLLGVNNAEMDVAPEAYFADGGKTPERLGLSKPRGAKSFELPGMGPAAGVVGTAAALSYLAKVGDVEARVRRLRDAVWRALEEGGLKVLTPEEADWSGIVLATTGARRGDEELYCKLREEGFRLHLRGMSGAAGLRFSAHFYVDEVWVDRLAAALRQR